MNDRLRHKCLSVKTHVSREIAYPANMNKDWRKIFADNLKTLRGNRSQQAVVGAKMQQRTYSRLEDVAHDATLKSIVIAADIYKVKPWVLLMDEEDRKMLSPVKEAKAKSVIDFNPKNVEDPYERIESALHDLLLPDHTCEEIMKLVRSKAQEAEGWRAAVLGQLAKEGRLK